MGLGSFVVTEESCPVITCSLLAFKSIGQYKGSKGTRVKDWYNNI